jgi:hypothetical protein
MSVDEEKGTRMTRDDDDDDKKEKEHVRVFFLHQLPKDHGKGVDVRGLVTVALRGRKEGRKEGEA